MASRDTPVRVDAMPRILRQRDKAGMTWRPPLNLNERGGERNTVKNLGRMASIAVGFGNSTRVGFI
jgi:hypothetical protein